MQLALWHPLKEIVSLQQELQNTFNSVRDQTLINPKVELYNDASNVYVNIELPGLNLEDINIEVSSKSVSIKAERKDVLDRTGYSEFSYGTFRRVISIPVKIVNDKSSASYVNGILKIQIPKAVSQDTEIYKLKPT